MGKTKTSRDEGPGVLAPGPSALTRTPSCPTSPLTPKTPPAAEHGKTSVARHAKQGDPFLQEGSKKVESGR
jgi:hypothetical protein